MPLSMRGAVVAVVVLWASACGSEPVEVDTDAATSVPASDAFCEQHLAVLLDVFKGDLADDYQPTESPNQMANEYSDYVVGADSVLDIAFDEGRVTMTLADLTVLPVHETDLTEPLTIEWWITSTDAEVPGRSAYDEISVVAFIEELDGTYRPLAEGLYVGCGDDGQAAALIAEPIEPDWPAGPDLKLATLATAVLDPAALHGNPEGAQSDGTFVSGPLTCYDDLFEDSIGEFDDEAVGADTPEDAVERWWVQGDGRFRDDRDRLTESKSGTQVLYDDDQGNTQLVLGRGSFPPAAGPSRRPWPAPTSSETVTLSGEVSAAPSVPARAGRADTGRWRRRLLTRLVSPLDNHDPLCSSAGSHSPIDSSA